MVTVADIRAEVLDGEDPTFEAGSTHTATALLTNPTTSEFTYTVELYLGITRVAVSGAATITLTAGGSVQQQFQIDAPIAEDTYGVYLDVWHAGTLLKHYKAVEDVTVQIAPDIDVGPIIWD